MTEPLWDVEVEAQHGQRVFPVTQRVRAKDEAHARDRAKDAANADLAGLGEVVRIVAVKRVTE